MSAIGRIGADIGGTFTDIAVLTEDGRLATRKIPSSPANYADAVVDGIIALAAELGSPLSALEEVLHGSTVATNLILEHKGARTALLTTKGFRDVLELRRIRVPALYQPLYVKPVPLVPRHLRFEIEERLDAGGNVLVPLNEADVHAAIAAMRRRGVEAVAVCFLHSYANASHERAVGAILRREMPDCFVSLSVDVLPQKREYERTSTTVINTYVGPPVSRYVRAMVEQMQAAGIGGRLMMMQSNGGILDAESVIETPAQIVECGPAAGVIGAAHVAAASGYANVITLDMGGTTAKASIVEKGNLAYAAEYEVGGGISTRSSLAGGGGYALKLPVIDISEVGAGGGSIAWLDKGGSLKIGPQSAGAVPGPACYGKGNEEPTVSDANVVLGYLNQTTLAGGTVPIDAGLSRAAVGRIASMLSRDLLETAYGIHTVANANMMKAVKAVTTNRGRDPRDFVLLAFGGNGGIHAVDLARVLQIGRVLVPMAAGVLSAVGMLFSKQEVTLTRPFHHLAQGMPVDKAAAGYATMAQQIGDILGGAGRQVAFRHEADARYLGQAFELTVPFSGGPFDGAAIAALCRRVADEHIGRYGHAFSGKFPVEVVNLRLTGTVEPSGPQRIAVDPSRRNGTPPRRPVYFGPATGSVDTPVIDRIWLDGTPQAGPFVIEEYEGTIVVPPDCRVSRDAAGNVVIELPVAAKPAGGK